MTEDFPELGDWIATRDALHGYSRILGAVQRALRPPHPRWWQLSLEVVPRGLATGPIPAPHGSESLVLTLDLRRHQLVVERAGEPLGTFDLGEGAPVATLRDRIGALLREAGLELPADFHPEAGAGPVSYRAGEAETYFRALRSVQRSFEEARAGFAGETGPIQLWPHHFDLSFEWYGTRIERYEEEGERVEAPAQIGFGFSTGDDSHSGAYFYANPWPFEEALLRSALPGAGSWHTEGWKGGLLPYTAVQGRGPAQLPAFLRTVYEAARPLLSA